LLSVSKKNLVVAAVALFVYSAMFLTEGIGLCLLKPWAEWMTVDHHYWADPAGSL